MSLVGARFRTAEARRKLVLVLLTLGALAPFANKAFHVDDPLFLWIAEQILREPFDPYGFTVNWSTIPTPAWIAMQNPPLCSYFIAAVAGLAGFHEVALHLLFVVWAVAAVLGSYAVARRFCERPAVVAGLTLFTPVFLVSATNVMCDVMLLALWLWSMEWWFRGLERRRAGPLIAAGLLAAAATLTKYFGFCVVPLLALYTVLGGREQRWRVLFLGIPLVVLAAYELLTHAAYGVPLMSSAGIYIRQEMVAGRHSLLQQALLGTAFAGGCLLPVMLFLDWRRARVLLGAAAFLAVGATLVKFSGLNLAGGINVYLQAAIFAALGLALVGLAVADVKRQRTPESILLFAWMLGTLIFAACLNWSVTARTILPMAPAACILVLRQECSAGTGAKLSFLGEPRLWLSALLALSLAYADYRQANAARAAADHFKQRYGSDSRVWFQGHWGFQYYMQKWGALSVDFSNPHVQSGEAMVIPQHNTSVRQIPASLVYAQEEITYEMPPLFSVFGYGTAAGFYSSILGPLPWVVGRPEPERFFGARVR